MARRPRPRQQPRVDDRRSAHQRGYDSAWKRLSLRCRRAHPLCEHCHQQGRVVPVQLVDHIIPIRGPDDPLRLDERNLQSLCRRCHTIKTSAEGGEIRQQSARFEA